MEKKFYYINDGRYIFMRFNTSAFGSKWCGLWKGTRKLMEYYAIKINNEWLGPHNCYRFLRINNMAKHWFKTKEFDVSEKVVLGNGLTIEINVRSREEKKVRVGMEVGVNIREREENAHERRYETNGEKEIAVSNEKGSLKFGRGAFEKREEYKKHFPGNYHEWDWVEGEQSVFVPGIIWQEGMSKKKGSLFKFYIVKPAQKSGHKGFFQEKRGFFAGIPWFLQVWGRDSGFVIPAYTDMKKYKWSRNALEILASYEKNGRIPNYIENEINYNSIDAGALFVIACEHYVKKSSDREFAKKMENTINNILNSQEYGLIKSNAKETWMDSENREGYNIDVQAVWAAAYSAGYRLYGKKEWGGKYEFLRKKINKDFWDGEYFRDNLENNKRTANPVFSLFFGLIDKIKAEKCFEILEGEEFLTPRGLRSVSKKDSSYNPASYHNGMVWGLLTGMLAYAERLYGRREKAKEILRIIKNNKGLRCVGGIDEVYDGETGEPRGCCSQAWSEIWETRINSEF